MLLVLGPDSDYQWSRIDPKPTSDSPSILADLGMLKKKSNGVRNRMERSSGLIGQATHRNGGNYNI